MRGCTLSVCENFLSQLPNIRELEVLDISMVRQDDFFVAIDVEHLFNNINLSSLKILEMQDIGELISDVSFLNIFSRALELKELNLIENKQISLSLGLLSQMKNLVRLELKGVSKLTDEILIDIFDKCQELSILNIECPSSLSSHMITDKSILACANSPGCVNKTILNFKNQALITDLSILAIGNNCLNLRVINLGSTNVTNLSVTNLISKRRNSLEFIELFNCHYITTDIILELVNQRSLLFKIGLGHLFANEDKVKLNQLLTLLHSRLPSLQIKKPSD